MNDQLIEIGKRLSEIRKIKGISVEDISKQLEITEDEYSNWEKDVDKTTSSMVDTIDKLSQEKEKDVMTV